MKVEVELLDPVVGVEIVPAERLLVYPTGGAPPPSELVRIAHLRAQWEGEEQRYEARRLLLEKASFLGADSVIDYREEVEAPGRAPPPSAGLGSRDPRQAHSTAINVAEGALTLLAVAEFMVWAEAEPAPRGVVVACATRKMLARNPLP